MPLFCVSSVASLAGQTRNALRFSDANGNRAQAEQSPYDGKAISSGIGYSPRKRHLRRKYHQNLKKKGMREEQ